MYVHKPLQGFCSYKKNEQFKRQIDALTLQFVNEGGFCENLSKKRLEQKLGRYGKVAMWSRSSIG